MKTYMSYEEMKARLWKHNLDDANAPAICGYIRFTVDGFKDKTLTDDERTFRVWSDNKAFMPGMGGYSVFGYNIGLHESLRLDTVMSDECGAHDWMVTDKCWMED